METNIKVILKSKFKSKIDWLSSNYSNEIAGFIAGTIKDNQIIVEDLLIPAQEVGTSSIEMNGKQISLLRKEYGKACEKIIGEWHSHCDMSCFWSVTDDDFINQYMEPRKIGIFIVSAKARHLIRIEVREPFGISIDKVPYSVEYDDNLNKSLKKEIEKKITERVGYVSNSTSTYYGGGGYTNEEKEFKQEVAKKVTYYNKTNIVVVGPLYWFYSDAVCQEFEDLNPEQDPLGQGKEYHNINFKFKTKEKAIDFMKDVKTFLLMVVRNEDSNTGGGINNLYELW